MQRTYLFKDPECETKMDFFKSNGKTAWVSPLACSWPFFKTVMHSSAACSAGPSRSLRSFSVNNSGKADPFSSNSPNRSFMVKMRRTLRSMRASERAPSSTRRAWRTCRGSVGAGPNGPLATAIALEIARGASRGPSQRRVRRNTRQADSQSYPDFRLASSWPLLYKILKYATVFLMYL